MEEYINKEAYELSLGQKQRITIAGVLSIEPKYIIMDEPTAMLDPEGKEEIRKIVKSLKDLGFTIIYITNIIDEIFISDRVIMLEKGRVIKDFETKEILENLEFLIKHRNNCAKGNRYDEKIKRKRNRYRFSRTYVALEMEDFMSYILQFLLFLVYTILIFFVKEYYILILVFVFNIMLMIALKESIKNAVIAILKLMPIIIFTTTINIMISGFSFGMLIGVRLIIVCNMTYIFSRKMTPNKLKYVIETILKPLKIIKIDSKEIAIILCIGISFIPIIQKEIIELKYSLKSKGFRWNFKSFIKKPNYILAPLITSIIKRIGEIENSLSSKGYV